MTNSKPDALLTSLPSELAFNDLRDASKRSRKAAQASPQDLHTVAAKSSTRRNMGCSIIDVMDSDWAQPLSAKAIKTAVFSGLRQSDVSLGVSADGLTRRRVNHHLTKPHILTQRLEMFEALLDVFLAKEDQDEDERSKAVMDAFQKGWVSELVPVFWCVGFLDEEHRISKTCPIVIRAGPHHLLCMWLKPICLGAYTLQHGKDTKPFRLLVDNFQNLKVCEARPAVWSDNSLVWKLGNWVELKEHLADFGMLTITQALLSKVCSTLRLKNHSKLNHKHRVELYLKHLGRSEEFIESILQALPDPKPRKKKAEADNPEEDQHAC
eukprot:Skav235132  [mRNA]  locus=scaffold321:196320:197291:+ [translate_table: standard]